MQKIINFDKFSSIRIGGMHEVEIFENIRPLEDYFLIGACNNLLISDKKHKFAMLGKNFDYIYVKDDLLHVGGATRSSTLLNFAKKNNLANFELLDHLPGTIGGIIRMNAGLKEHEISNHLIAIRTEHGLIKKQDLGFCYRKSEFEGVVYEAIFKLENNFNFELLAKFKSMRDNQPKAPSCGSCFKNPPNDWAGRLIEKVGLKGFKKGGMSFSDKHANFLTNQDHGSFQDAIWLINEAKRRTHEQFGIKLEEEIIIV